MKSSVLFILFSFGMHFYINAQIDMSVKNTDTTQIDQKFFNLGYQYFEKDKYTFAIQYFDSAIVYNQEYMDAYAFRGICKLETKRYMDAIEDFDYALILESGYAEIYVFRGDAKKALDDIEKACEDYFEAYSLGLRTVMSRMKENCNLEPGK